METLSRLFFNMANVFCVNPFCQCSGEAPPNLTSNLSFMKGMLPSYFSSEWSFCQFQVPQVTNICSFGLKNSVVGECNIYCDIGFGGWTRYWLREKSEEVEINEVGSKRGRELGGVV